MKKFIPYILIVAMIGTFLFLSFSGPSKVSAETQTEDQGGLWDRVKEKFGPDAWVVVGKKIYNDPLNQLNPGYVLADNLGDYLNWGKVADATIGQILAWISSFTWHVSAKLFTMSGYLLDYAVDFSVKDFKDHIDQISVINTGYKIILNVTNMLFIFTLLYIAIKTILGMGGDMKKLLINIIVVGLFINFSLFMTKTIIDASNILAMGFYNGVLTEAGKAKVNVNGTNEEKNIISQGSISTAMMVGLRLQTMIASPESASNKNDPYKGLTNFNITVNNLGGSAVFLVSAFVFASVALLFIVRFVALLFYMLFSPVAFLGLISDELKGYSAKWWKGLQSQALFAPAFLFMAYLISAIINSGQLWTAVGGNDSKSTLYDAFSSPTAGAFPIIMNYVILIALMIGALILAKSMASEGSAGITKYTGKFQSWAQGVAGRNTLGRAAYLAGNNRYMEKLMAKSPTLGTFAKTQFDNIAGQKFGSKIGYEAALKKSIDKKKKMADFVAKSKVGKTDKLIRKEEELIDQKMESVIKLKNNVNDAKIEHGRLADTASRTKATADLDAAQLAYESLQREEAILDNQSHDINRAKENIETIKSYRDRVRNRMKKEYTKNIEFESGILNKLFPSGAGAAAEIRKGKSTGEKEIAELLDKLVAEKTKEQTGGGGGSGGASPGGTTGGGAGPTTP